MEAYVDLKSESVAQTRSENTTIRHTSRRVVAPTCRPIAKVVQSSDRKPRLPATAASAGGTLVNWSANAQHSGCSRYSL